MNIYFEKYKRWTNKMEVRARKPLTYDFIMAFKLMVVIYFLSTLFDAYEFSHIIKMTFAGDKFYFLLSILFFLAPILIVCYAPMKYKKKHGYYPYISRYYLMLLFMGSWMHVYGGFTNFIHIINLSIIHT